jgi:formate--tetrahydrofolate ligase
MLYDDDEPIATKIRKIATTVYGADGIELAAAARESIARIESQGLSHLPICMAKTHLSLSHDPALRNRPEGFVVPIRDIRVYSGAGMLVPLCGDMLQMPGFGPTPAAFAIDIDDQGETVGLF